MTNLPSEDSALFRQKIIKCQGEYDDVVNPAIKMGHPQWGRMKGYFAKGDARVLSNFVQTWDHTENAFIVILRARCSDYWDTESKLPNIPPKMAAAELTRIGEILKGEAKKRWRELTRKWGNKPKKMMAEIMAIIDDGLLEETPKPNPSSAVEDTPAPKMRGKTNGGADIPPEVLRDLSRQQRAIMEAMWSCDEMPMADFIWSVWGDGAEAERAADTVSTVRSALKRFNKKLCELRKEGVDGLAWRLTSKEAAIVLKYPFRQRV